MFLRELVEGVGRITKQNQTQDVGPNQISIEAAKLGFKVDRDGRPANTAKSPTSNILFNIGLAESVLVKLERDKRNDIYVLHMVDSKDKHRVELRGEKGYETGNYNQHDRLHQVLDGLGKAVDLGALFAGETVSINPHHPDGEQALGIATAVMTNADKAAITETKNYQNFVKFCCQGLKIKNQPKINLTQEKFDDTFGFFNADTDQLTIRTQGRHPADVMRTLAHELVHHKQKENGEDLDGSDGSEHENQANSIAGVLMRRWANRHPEIFENFADGKKKGKSRPGRVKRSGASCNGSVTSLRKKAAKYSGEKGKMYHWCANMKSGRKK